MKRPLTTQIAEMWRVMVQNHQTDLSLQDWADQLDPVVWLSYHGLHLGKRDRNINQDYEGDLQIAEFYPPGTSTRDGADGPWAVVGDDRNALIQEGVSYVAAFWPAYETKSITPHNL